MHGQEMHLILIYQRMLGSKLVVEAVSSIWCYKSTMQVWTRYLILVIDLEWFYPTQIDLKPKEQGCILLVQEE